MRRRCAGLECLIGWGASGTSIASRRGVKTHNSVVFKDRYISLWPRRTWKGVGTPPEEEGIGFAPEEVRHCQRHLVGVQRGEFPALATWS